MDDTRLSKTSVNFYFSVPPPQGTTQGWVVENLPLIKVPLRVVEYNQGISTYNETYFQGVNAFTNEYTTENMAILEPIDGSPAPLIDVPVYVKGSPSMIHEPYYSTNFIAGHFNTFTYDPKAKVIVKSKHKDREQPAYS
jgi:hypothetical protein